MAASNGGGGGGGGGGGLINSFEEIILLPNIPSCSLWEKGVIKLRVCGGKIADGEHREAVYIYKSHAKFQICMTND